MDKEPNKSYTHFMKTVLKLAIVWDMDQQLRVPVAVVEVPHLLPTT